jgi:hypothetical protein
MRTLAICAVLLSQLTLPGIAQQASTQQPETTSCTFDDGHQMTIRYNNSASSRREEPHDGRLWMPGGVPMILFTQTDLILNHADIPAGAYSMYFIPDKKKWTVIVNKNVTPVSEYNPTEDIARAEMDMGRLSSPLKQPEVALGHVAPKQCNMRLYYGKTGVWTEFEEK